MYRLIIEIRVQDLQRAVVFYTQVLGFTCRIQEESWAGIQVGDAEIHLYKDGGATRDIEFYVDDIDSEVARLKALGIVFISGEDKPQALCVDENNITSFPWGKTAFFKDSEGNELALVQDVQ